ncbi:hypothetical protein Bca4012_029533 [Brassica carinata]
MFSRPSTTPTPMMCPTLPASIYRLLWRSQKSILFGLDKVVEECTSKKATDLQEYSNAKLEKVTRGALRRNDRKQNINEAGRQSIIDKFYEAYGERHPWKKFGIKHTTCKTQYTKYKRLIHKRTGLGYDPFGFIDMSDDWWNELFKVYNCQLDGDGKWRNEQPHYHLFIQVQLNLLSVLLRDFSKFVSQN